MKKSYAVFGLGRYGTAIARELAAAGADVLAVDRNEAVVNAVAADVPFCKCADVTDPDAIKVDPPYRFHLEKNMVSLADDRAVREADITVGAAVSQLQQNDLA